MILCHLLSRPVRLLLLDNMCPRHNQLTVITAALVNRCGGDIHKIALSKSTSRRSRDSRRRSVLTTIKRNFSCAVGQVKFDGKLLPNLYGYGKVNRLAVVLVKENVNQLLCITETADSTGLIEARAVEAALNDWGCAEKIVAMGFDTTASNTGVHRGACTFLQLQLQRQLLWLACRHHIAELILRSAFDSLFGDITGPEVVLFKVLRKTWDSLDLQNIQLPNRIPAVYRGRVDPLLAFIDNRLDPANRDLLPRCDYKEYLELAKLFLGGSITREKGYVYSIQRPGADHHASVDEQGHLHSEDESRTASDPRSALDTEEEGGEDGSLRGVCLPRGVVLSNSPGLRSFERPSLLVLQASRLLQSSRQEDLPFCH